MIFNKNYPPTHIPTIPKAPKETHEIATRKTLEAVIPDKYEGIKLVNLLTVLQKYAHLDEVSIKIKNNYESYDGGHYFDIEHTIREEVPNPFYKKEVKKYQNELAKWEEESKKAQSILVEWEAWKKEEEGREIQQRLKEAKEFVAKYEQKNAEG